METVPSRMVIENRRGRTDHFEHLLHHRGQATATGAPSPTFNQEKGVSEEEVSMNHCGK